MTSFIMLKMFLYLMLGNWLKKYGFRRSALYKGKCKESTKCRQILSKIWCPGALETFGRFPRKHPWWSHFWIIESEILLKEGLYHQCSLSWEIFENEWLLTAPSDQLGTVTFVIFQFLTKAVSFSCQFL